ncbi:hypothetical protein [Chryseobacterium endophyticum]|uniref:CRISPR-associated protein Cas2 n=1 Tax=Chryseobacterium endophyticum TaxID=1854762 RepID=A0AAU6WU95_9FLAO|nr:hypothetical protein [uncultured Chryseobacterium sp.]
MVYCIGYDLNSPGKDYKDLIEQIKTYDIWWHHLDSTWFVVSDKTASEIRDHLSKYIDSNDELLIFKTGDSWAGKGFSEKGYKWLHNNWKK